MISEEVVAIVASVEAGVHVFQYTEDKVLTIGINPEMLDVKRDLPDCTKLDQEEIAALRGFLKEIPS